MADGSLVASNVHRIDFNGLTNVESEGDVVSVETSVDGQDADLGVLSADSLTLDTNQTIEFGDNGEATMRYDSETGRFEVTGDTRFSGGTFKGPYDTDNYVHDMLLPGMHAYSTDAVGVQDNVLGYADEWADVSHTPFSEDGRLRKLFKPGPSGWAGWNQPDDFPATITIAGLEDDWGPGRAMVMFQSESPAGRVALELRNEGSWTTVAEENGNTGGVVVLSPKGHSKPVDALRWTFDDPVDGERIRIAGLFYYSMSIKGNTWLPKERGETTGLTFLPSSPPPTPESGATLYADESAGEIRTRWADGSEQRLRVGAREQVTRGTVTLSDGKAEVGTGVTEPGAHLNVHLDPTGAGANADDVSVRSSVRWDSAAGEYRVDVVEDGTDRGDPDVGFVVTRL
jgi:hypothetical protein